MGAGSFKIRDSTNGVYQALGSISLLELLEQDPRPMFILDLYDVKDPAQYQVQSVACNSSLQSFLESQDGHPAIANMEHCLRQLEPSRYKEFKEWVVGYSSGETSISGDQVCFIFGGLLWDRFTIRKRWRIISGSATNHTSNVTEMNTKYLSANTLHASAQRSGTKCDNDPEMSEASQSAEVKMPVVSWTDALPTNEHTQLFKNTNWGNTPLGPLETWSPHLRQMVLLLMSDSRATSLFW